MTAPGDEIGDLLAQAEAALADGSLELAAELVDELGQTDEPGAYLERAALQRRLLLASDERWSRFPAGEQLSLRFEVLATAPPGDWSVVIPQLLEIDDLPYNGYRFAPREGHSGWVLWAGETEPGQAGSMNTTVSMLTRYWPEVVPYLSLPAGWCFQIAPDHEDVWFFPDLVEGAR